MISLGNFSVRCYRLGRWLYSKRVPLLPPIIRNIVTMLTSCEIHEQTEIGPGLVIYHPEGTVIRAERIGRNCSIYSGVTIGTNLGSRAMPVIGDNVQIFTGAKVLGGVTIGNNAKVGANAVVITDVPDNATVVGIPARVVKP